MMKSTLAQRIVVVMSAVVLFMPMRADAQATRSALVDSAQVLIDNFDERSSIVLLQRALDPALGAPDAAWVRGVQLLAQTLLQTNQEPQARAWLRWAIRLSPSFQPDNVNFTPRLVAASEAARSAVARGPADPRARVRFEWAPAPPADGSGALRIEPGAPGQAAGLQLTIDSVGSVELDRARRLSPGSYRLVARAAGVADAEVTAEVLPGVTTVVALAMGPVTAQPVAPDAGAANAGRFSGDVERAVLASVARIDAGPDGGAKCHAGVFVGAPRQLMTSYTAIRGAEQLAVRLGDRRVGGDAVRIAAYDVNADLAVLSLSAAGGDSLRLDGTVGRGDTVWAVRYPSCGESPAVTATTVTGQSGNVLSLGEAEIGAADAGIIVNAMGAVVGILTGPRSARSVGAATELLQSATRNVAQGSLLSAPDVALREKHAIGEVSLSSSIAGARARVTPIESWQWSEAARTDALPFTFRGPMGRYQVEIFDGERVISRTELAVEPGTSRQVVLGSPKKGRSKLLPILGGLAAGGIVAVLAGGGDDPPTPTTNRPTTGGIIIRLP